MSALLLLHLTMPRCVVGVWTQFNSYTHRRQSIFYIPRSFSYSIVFDPWKDYSITRSCIKIKLVSPNSLGWHKACQGRAPSFPLCQVEQYLLVFATPTYSRYQGLGSMWHLLVISMSMYKNYKTYKTRYRVWIYNNNKFKIMAFIT